MNPPGWTPEDVAYGLGHTHALPKRNSPFAKHCYRRPFWDHVSPQATCRCCDSVGDGFMLRGCLQLQARAPVLQGFPPEMFPAGYDDYLMKCMIHPEMLAIHRQMIGALLSPV